MILKTKLIIGIVVLLLLSSFAYATADTLINPFAMTSDILPSPYVITVNSNYADYEGYKAFDKSIVTWWAQSSSQAYGWVDLDLGVLNTSVVTKVSMYPHTTNEAPSDFTIQGSNDGSTYTTLLTVTGATPILGYTNWSINNTDAYRYLKFNVTKVVTSELGIMEINFYTNYTAPLSTGTMTFLNQTPSDINTVNVLSLGQMNATFSYTNTTSIQNFSIYYHAGLNGSCWVYYNKTCQSGTGFSISNNSVHNPSNVTYILSDNEIYPASYLMDEVVMEDTDHQNYTLPSEKDMILATFYNISPSKSYSFIEDMPQTSSGTGSLEHYYCNSSYSITSKVTTSTNCELFYTLASGTEFNHTHKSGKSKHVNIPFSIINGSVGDVKVSPTSHIILRGAVDTNWQIAYINSTACNPSLSRYTENSGSSWTIFPTSAGSSICPDMHLHQYNSSENLCYIGSLTLTDDVQVNSSMVCDKYEIATFPPNAPIITTPLEEQTITTNLSINYTECSTIYGNITAYYINITSGGTNYLSVNNYLNLTYIWEPSYSQNGDFILRVDCIDNNSLSSFSTIPFTLELPRPSPYNNTAPPDWSINFDINSTSGILLLFFYLALLTLVFTIGCVLRVPLLVWLAAAMMFFLGFIIGIKASILFGILITLSGAVLFFVGVSMMLAEGG